MAGLRNMEALKEGEVKVLVAGAVDLGRRTSQRSQSRPCSGPGHWRIFECGGIIKSADSSAIFVNAGNYVGIGTGTGTSSDLAGDGLRLPAVESQNGIDTPATGNRVFETVHVVSEILALAKGKSIGSAADKLILDIKRGKSGVVLDRGNRRSTITGDAAAARSEEH